MPEIQTRIEGQRGCGYRKEGGLYLICKGKFETCGKLPSELNCCPTCGVGIKFARGWTWIDPSKLFAGVTCRLNGEARNSTLCILSDVNLPGLTKAGLLWIGEKFYPIPDDWIREAVRTGISRRVNSVPRGFEVGKTWVFAAHIKAIPGDPSRPGIFQVFKPMAIEYVVRGDETDKQLEDLEKRGVTLVKVIRKEEQSEFQFEQTHVSIS